MLTVSVSQEELQAAGRVSRSVVLDGIRLLSLNTHGLVTDSLLQSNEKCNVNLNLNYRSEKKELVDSNFLSAMVHLEVSISEKKESSPEFKIILEYLLKYRLPGVPIPADLPESAFAAFAKHNGLLNCWPYMRMQVFHLSSELGVPITLPLLRIAAEPQTSKAKELGSSSEQNNQ